MPRPSKEINIDQVEKLAAIQCTQKEIAAILGVSEDTITRRKQDDPDFADALKRGYDSGKASLRRNQFKLAQKNATMAIWLGKQYLGQRDKESDDTQDKQITVVIDSNLMPQPQENKDADKPDGGIQPAPETT